MPYWVDLKHWMNEKTDLVLVPLARPFTKYGITATHISSLQIPFIIMFSLGLIGQNLFYTIVGLGAVIFLDVFDGAWARATGMTSKEGQKLDDYIDIFSSLAFLFASAIGFPELMAVNVLLAFTLMLSYFTIKFIPPIRPFGFLGVLFSSLPIFMLLSIGASIVIFLYELVKVKTRFL